MENYRKTVKHDLNLLKNSKKELKDIFEIIFSHSDKIACEWLLNLHIQTITYKELKEKIIIFATNLRTKYKPNKDEFIGIDLNNSPLFIISFWGSLMAGYSPYLINKFYPLNLRISLLKRLNINKVITNCDEYNGVAIKIDEQFILTQDRKQELNDFSWSNNFAISSSLTGLEAKIVIYDGYSISSEIENSDKIIAKNPWFMKDYKKCIKVAAILPFFHIFGIMVSYFWFAFFGRTMVFFNNLSSECVRATIIRHHVTHIFAPPIVFNKMYEGIMNGLKNVGDKKTKSFYKAINLVNKVGDVSPNLALKMSKILLREVRYQVFGDSPSFMISGGSYIGLDVLKIINGIGYPLFNGYGTTESSITSANLSLKFSKRINSSVGKPFPSVGYKLTSDGILTIKGKSLAKKILYLDGRQEDINEFKTNDIFYQKDGDYFISGRLDDLYIGKNGENISPDLIEEKLKIDYALSFSIINLNDNLCLILQYNPTTSPLLIKKEYQSIINQLSKISYGNNVNKIFYTYDDISNHNLIKMSRKQLSLAIKIKMVNLKSIDNIKEEKNVENNDLLLSIIELFKKSLNNEVIVNYNSDYFLDLNGDSLGYISLLASIEQTFDIHFNLEKENAPRTPMQFYERIKNKS